MPGRAGAQACGIHAGPRIPRPATPAVARPDYARRRPGLRAAAGPGRVSGMARRPPPLPHVGGRPGSTVRDPPDPAAGGRSPARSNHTMSVRTAPPEPARPGRRAGLRDGPHRGRGRGRPPPLTPGGDGRRPRRALLWAWFRRRPSLGRGECPGDAYFGRTAPQDMDLAWSGRAVPEGPHPL